MHHWLWGGLHAAMQLWIGKWSSIKARFQLKIKETFNQENISGFLVFQVFYWILSYTFYILGFSNSSEFIWGWTVRPLKYTHEKLVPMLQCGRIERITTRGIMQRCTAHRRKSGGCDPRIFGWGSPWNIIVAYNVQKYETRSLSKEVTFRKYKDLCILNNNSGDDTLNSVLRASGWWTFRTRERPPSFPTRTHGLQFPKQIDAAGTAKNSVTRGILISHDPTNVPRGGDFSKSNINFSHFML